MFRKASAFLREPEKHDGEKRFCDNYGSSLSGLAHGTPMAYSVTSKVNSPLEFYMIWLHAPGVSRQRRLPLSVPDILPYFWSA